MSTLFLIGNGFDLNCGMKTAYRDIYPGYVKEPSESNIIINFKKSIAEDINTWGDFELAMAKYAGTLKNEAELLECVRDFSSYANDYLAAEELRVKKYLQDANVRERATYEMRESMEGFYSGFSHNIDNIMQRRAAGFVNAMKVVSFNYTSVFDTIFNMMRGKMALIPAKIIHIHGMLQEDPFFGVDNEAQLAVNYPITKRTQRGFIKPYFNECYDHERVKKTVNCIQEASTICTYGLSLGDSDLTWRNAILTWLSDDSSHHLFFYDYRFANTTYKTISEKMDMEDEAREELLKKWNVENPEAIMERIHIPIGKNIFNIAENWKSMERETA